MKKLKDRIKDEFSALKKELPVIEYVIWWLLRISMLVTAVVFTYTEAPYVRNLILLNTLATFTVPILRFISPKKLFTSKISFRTQTYIDLFVLMGSFMGHGLKFLGKFNEYDKFMHFVAGFVVSFIGVEILKALKDGKKASPAIACFCGIGFSFVAIVLWENMEFFADWFITSSTNQGYLDTPDEKDIFIKIFGFSKNFEQQKPVYDTNVDMFFAAVGCFIGAIPLYFIEKHKSLKLNQAKEKIPASL